MPQPAGSFRIDTHAHVFCRGLPLAPKRRYVPGYDAPVWRYLDLLDRHGVEAGVLVQPSFLGTDNRFLQASLQSSPKRLRGVAVVAPAIADEELRGLHASGVRAIRHNLIGEDPGFLAKPAWRRLTERVTALGWSVQLHMNLREMLSALEATLDAGAVVVVDHFGRPDGPKDPAFERLLRFAECRRVYVKLSAAYRLRFEPRGFVAVSLERLGPDRLLWGSDWPWTQHEEGRRYQESLDAIASLVPEPGDRKRMDRTARRLFDLPGASRSSEKVVKPALAPRG